MNNNAQGGGNLPAANNRIPAGPVQQGPSKGQQAAAKIKSAKIETVFLVQKILQLVAVVLLVPFGFARLKYLDNFCDLMVSVYMELFAVVFVLVEFNLLGGRTKFYFLNSSLGKGLFYVFLFLFCFANNRNGAIWVDVFLAVVFFILAVLMLFMHAIFRRQEQLHIEQLMAQIAISQPKTPAEPKKATSAATPATPANKV